MCADRMSGSEWVVHNAFFRGCKRYCECEVNLPIFYNGANVRTGVVLSLKT